MPIALECCSKMCFQAETDAPVKSLESLIRTLVREEEKNRVEHGGTLPSWMLLASDQQYIFLS